MKPAVLRLNLMLVALALALSGCSAKSDNAADTGPGEIAAADANIPDGARGGEDLHDVENSDTGQDLAAAKDTVSPEDQGESADSKEEADSPTGDDITAKEEVAAEVVAEVVEEVVAEVVEEVAEDVVEEVIAEVVEEVVEEVIAEVVEEVVEDVVEEVVEDVVEEVVEEVLEEVLEEVCEAACENKECGDDGCGGSCGECPQWLACDGQDICTPATTQCPPPGPYGQEVGDPLADAVLLDCDGKEYAIHDLCPYKLSWIFVFAGW